MPIMRVIQMMAAGENFFSLYGLSPTDLVAAFDQTRPDAGDLSIWNDNWGGGNHIEQLTVGSQPAIVGNGRVFDSTTDFMHQQILASGAVTLANAKKSLVDGAAFIDIGVDLSAHAGADSGNHERIFKLIDSSGKVAWGYIGANGGGEAYGGELWEPDAAVFTAGTYSWIPFGGNAIANDANTLKITYVTNSGGAYVYFSVANGDLISDLTTKALYKLGCDVKVGAGDSVRILVSTVAGNWDDTAITSTVFINYTSKFLCDSTGFNYVYPVGMGAGEEIWFDNMTLKQITDCSTDGLHILSTKDGSTQNWTFVDAAFDFKDTAGYTYEIVKAGFELTGDMAIFWWGKPDDGQPAAEQILCAKMDETNSFMAFGLILDAAGKIVAVASNDGAVRDAFISDAAVFADGVQAASKLICMIYTASTGNIDIIVNDAEVASTEQNDVSTAIYNSQVKFQLGKAEDGSFFDGSQTMCLIYGRAPTVAEALAFYNATSERTALYGPELITDAADRDFSAGQGNWTINTASGEITFDNVSMNFALTAWNTSFITVALNEGALYKLQFDIIDYTSGGLICYIGGDTHLYVAGESVDTFVIYSQAEALNFIRFGSADFIGKLDNISLKEVL